MTVTVDRYTAFISDLHLGPERPDMVAAFERFLRNEAVGAEALYILGDLFEYWVGDDVMADPFNQRIIQALRELATHGVPVSVMRGNRDFLFGTRFAQATGARLIDDPTVIELHGRRTLLMHGDTLCTDDVRYLAYRARVRNPLYQRLILALPLALRLAIARRLRAASETDKARKSATIMDVTKSAVEAALVAHGCRRLIHGHTHRPARHEHIIQGESHERIVLADWYEHAAYLRCTPASDQAIALA